MPSSPNVPRPRIRRSPPPARRPAAASIKHLPPAPPIYLRRFGWFLAPLLVLIGFLIVVGSARMLLMTAPASGATNSEPAARQFLHATAHLTNTQNILILGSDQRSQDAMWRTDVIMLAAIDRTDGRAAVVSLPRDLYVDIPGYGMGRINTADYIGSDQGRSLEAGLEMLHKIIERDLGVEIDNYVRIDFDGFQQIIDALGGVEVEVDCPLQDPYLMEAIGVERIEPGRQLMDGKTALAYVRTRRQGGDFDRARRQQRLLMAVRNRIVAGNLTTRLPQLAPAALRSAETDLNPLEVVSLARWAVGMDVAQLKGFVIDADMTSFETLPSGEQILRPDWTSIHQGLAGLFGAATKPLLETNDRSWYCPGSEDLQGLPPGQ